MSYQEKPSTYAFALIALGAIGILTIVATCM